MKKFFYMSIITAIMCVVLLGCGSKTENNTPIANTPIPEANVPATNPSENAVTKEMAYEGVNNYCHREYEWRPAEEDSFEMYVAMGDETETEYMVIFRSYTGAFRYFYVNKLSGTTRMVEYVPGLNVENEVGTINIYDYLNNSENEEE